MGLHNYTQPDEAEALPPHFGAQMLYLLILNIILKDPIRDEDVEPLPPNFDNNFIIFCSNEKV
jgi:hypothetical protein